MDGNTPSGRKPVKITFTEDEARQLIRSMEWAKMMDLHADKPDKGFPQPETMDVLAHRAFLQQILDKLHTEIKAQLKD